MIRDKKRLNFPEGRVLPNSTWQVFLKRRQDHNFINIQGNIDPIQQSWERYNELSLHNFFGMLKQTLIVKKPSAYV